MGANTTAVDAKTAWGGGRAPFGISYGKMMMWFFLISDALTFGGFLASYGLTRHHFQDIWPSAENVFTHFPFLEGDHPLLYVAFMTFILIMSSVTMVLAVEAGHRMSRREVLIWLGLTILGGLIFVGSQAWEWYHFIHGTELGAVELGKGYLTLPSGQVVETKGIIARWASEAKDTLLLPWKDDAGNYIALTGQEMQKVLAGAKEIFGANLIHNEYGVPAFGDFFFFITGFHGTHVFSGVVLNFVIFINVIKGTYEKKGHYEMVEKVGLYWHFVDLVWVFVFTFFYLV